MQSPTLLSNPALTVALALAVGTVAQALADRLRMPAIVVLLVLGVALGPQGAGLVHPQSLGRGLLVLVGFAVAVILFEGGMNLNLRRMQREDRAIRRLVLLGPWVTAGGAALAAHLLLGWSFRLSALFGTLVIVTGPTVVTPLLRRLKVEHSTATVLEAEGVLIDAVGAIIAAGALEVALSPGTGSLASTLLHSVFGLGLGALLGAVGGVVIGVVTRLVREELRNVLALSLVLTLFHASNAVVSESGIAAVTVAGIVVGNRYGQEQRELLLFKEQLTLMFIGMLFVLLAADVRLSSVHVLGMEGVLVVLALMLVVRPLNVALSTRGTALSFRQRLFIAWIAPRGIVAAAMASLFAVELQAHDVAGGRELRALVFLVISITVVTAGLTGGLAARALNLQRPAEAGWILLGANELARLLAHTLKHFGDDVVCIDTDPHACKMAEKEGLRVILGNALEPRTLQRAYIDTRAGALGVATTTEANLLFAQRTKAEGRLAQRFVAVGRTRAQFGQVAVRQSGARVMFGQPADLDHWNVRIRRQTARLELWRWDGDKSDKLSPHPLREAPEDLFLPLVARSGERRPQPVTDKTELARDDLVVVLANRERDGELNRWLSGSKLRFERVLDEIEALRRESDSYRPRPSSSAGGSSSSPPPASGSRSAPPASGSRSAPPASASRSAPPAVSGNSSAPAASSSSSTPAASSSSSAASDAGSRPAKNA